MDRLMVYPGAIPLDTDVLSVERNVMTALGWLAQASFGANTGVVGLACNPTVPASMTVNIGSGALWAQAVIDQSNFGSLPADTSPLMKMGILPEAVGTNFTLTAPVTSGESINYLIEAAFEETDENPVVLPYVNPANPSQPYTGPNNSGTSQNTVRAQTIALQLKAGVAANTGTQTTPTVDAGYVGLYVITVNFGQTTITAANIMAYANAPFNGGPFAPLAGNPAQTFMGAPATQNDQLVTLGQFTANSFKNIAVFTTTGATLNGISIPGWVNGGNWSPPTNVLAEIIVTGGGGSGAGCYNNGSSIILISGPCGGAAGTAILLTQLSNTVEYQITVGFGGFNPNAGQSGFAGATSSFGTIVSATSGGGGSYPDGDAVGGGGGVGYGGDLNIIGGSGSDGLTNPNFAGIGLGMPGCSFWGGGVRSGQGNGQTTGAAWGAGGGGAYSANGQAYCGNAGANGIVVVRF